MTKNGRLRHSSKSFHVSNVIGTLVLRPSNSHKKNNSHGGDKHYEAVHFK